MNDEHFYSKVVEELRLHGPIPGLWAKAYSESNGNKPRAEALYLRYRAEQLAQAERDISSRTNQGNDDLKSLCAEVLENFAKHAPFLIGILALIALMALHYLE